jgi:hypothetical protein
MRRGIWKAALEIVKHGSTEPDKFLGGFAQMAMSQ